MYTISPPSGRLASRCREKSASRVSIPTRLPSLRLAMPRGRPITWRAGRFLGRGHRKRSLPTPKNVGCSATTSGHGSRCWRRPRCSCPNGAVPADCAIVAATPGTPPERTDDVAELPLPVGSSRPVDSREGQPAPAWHRSMKSAGGGRDEAGGAGRQQGHRCEQTRHTQRSGTSRRKVVSGSCRWRTIAVSVSRSAPASRTEDEVPQSARASAAPASSLGSPCCGRWRG